jgi:hypothetical protein
MTWKFDHFFFLNRADRPDRRVFMEEQAAKLKLTCTRIEAPALDEPAFRFMNKRVRSNWIGHEMMVEQGIQLKRPFCVLEDDAWIFKADKIIECVNEIQSIENWDLLYFYDGTKDFPIIYGTLNTHAYLVNDKSAEKLLNLLRQKRVELEKEGEKEFDSFLDRFMIKMMGEDKLIVRGAQTLIIQDRQKFGSDIGWGCDGNPRIIED